MMASRSGCAALGSLPTSRRQQGMLRMSALIRAKDCARSPGNWKSVLGARARSASPGGRTSALQAEPDTIFGATIARSGKEWRTARGIRWAMKMIDLLCWSIGEEWNASARCGSIAIEAASALPLL